MDFGLAKLTEQGMVTEGHATLTLKPQTDAGTVIGTAAYMSPEQAEGKLLDPRSDIFSFGAVLYEMATGRRAFPGGSPAASIAAVLNKEPKLSEVAQGLPHELERVITRCLRKDPTRRLQHVTDVRVLLEELKEESESGKLEAVVVRNSSGRRWRLVGAAAAVIIASYSVWLWLSGDHGQQQARVVPLTAFAGSEDSPSFSPDGNQVVFSWDGEKQDNWDLYVKMIGSATVLRLTTDGAPDMNPAWSPDGRQIQSGVWFYQPFVELGLEPGVQFVHDRLTVLLVEAEAFLR